MIVIPLQSGSSGNCIYVESGNTRLLFDAGISGIKAEQRLALYGRDIRDVDAVIISHEHTDHIQFAGVYQRKYSIPIYITQPTLDSATSRMDLGRLDDIRYFKAGETYTHNSVSVWAVSTMHDAADGVAFVVEADGRRLGILTDLGHAFDGLPEIVSSLDAVLIESNYDACLLDGGPYPAFLKKRISGLHGHLSNKEAAELISEADSGRLAWICLAHLSDNNNRPDLAMKAFRDSIRPELPLYAAGRYTASAILEL